MGRFLFLMCILFFGSCSKDENPSPFTPFIGTWTGYIANINDPQDVHSVTLQFDKDVFSFTGAIIPDHKYLIVAFEGSELKEGDMMLILHNSTPDAYIVKAIFNPLEADKLRVAVDIREVGKYEGIILRKF